MYNVEFKDNDSQNLQLTPLSVGRRQRAQEQIEVNPIPYSDKEAVVHTGKYYTYDRSIDFYVADESQIDAINQWLVGYGKLKVSKDAGGFYKAHVISGLEYDKYLQVKDKMTVTFKINPPFFYLSSGDMPLLFNTPGVINNPGTHISEPYIKITGSGVVNLDINGEVIQVAILQGYMEIDSEIEYAYKGTENLGDNMTGKFPKLKPGVNNISWTGTVTSIEIIPRWRSL